MAFSTRRVRRGQSPSTSAWSPLPTAQHSAPSRFPDIPLGSIFGTLSSRRRRGTGRDGNTSFRSEFRNQSPQGSPEGSTGAGRWAVDGGLRCYAGRPTLRYRPSGRTVVSRGPPGAFAPIPRAPRSAFLPISRAGAKAHDTARQVIEIVRRRQDCSTPGPLDLWSRFLLHLDPYGHSRTFPPPCAGSRRSQSQRANARRVASILGYQTTRQCIAR